MSGLPLLTLECAYPHGLGSFLWGVIHDVEEADDLPCQCAGCAHGMFPSGVYGTGTDGTAVTVKVHGLDKLGPAGRQQRALERIADIMCDNFGESMRVTVRDRARAFPPVFRNMRAGDTEEIPAQP